MRASPVCAPVVAPTDSLLPPPPGGTAGPDPPAWLDCPLLVPAGCAASVPLPVPVAPVAVVPPVADPVRGLLLCGFVASVVVAVWPPPVSPVAPGRAFNFVFWSVVEPV